MCCPGCAAAASAIVDLGLADYYRTRSGMPATAEPMPAELKLYDTAQSQARFVECRVDGQRSVSLALEGIHCVACAWLIESRLLRLDGVLNVHLNLATERAEVIWQEAQCQLSDILQAVRQIGYLAYPDDPQRHEAALQSAAKKMLRQLFVAGLAMMQVMMYALPAYITQDGTLDADSENLMRWASLMLTLPVVGYSAQPFFQGAWRSLKNHSPGMDVPVAIGVAAAFIGSAVATWRGTGEVYFDSVTMFIFLLLCSRALELNARRKAVSTLERLQRSLPAAANRLIDFPHSRTHEIVAPVALRVGDILLVKPGEALAADCQIIEGASAFDYALLSGESQPLARKVGDLVPGGALNMRQALLVKVERLAHDSTLSVLQRLIERAGLHKPRLALWADQVAGWFVIALLLLALLTFIYWTTVDPQRAWPIAIAVLVVSCPCALSLATPAALAAASAQLLENGVLIVQGHMLETLHRASHIIFDKTGTLTLGRPSLQQLVVCGRASDAHSDAYCRQIAAALESANAHPLAAALTEAAAHLPQVHATELCHHSGQGIAGIVDGQRYYLGTAAFVAQLSGAMPDPSPFSLAPPGQTPVYLGSDAGWLARFSLADGLREDALQVVQHFQRQGKTVMILSGDQHAVVQQMAQQCGIDSAYGDMLPEQKLSFVQNLQTQGAVVVMVGDGLNDAAVLRAADGAIAMGTGAALALASADAVVLGQKLAPLGHASVLASKTMGVIRQNLAWALAYNLLAIPAAAMGWINPWMSGIGMSLSSAVVVLNALRLRGTGR